MYLNGDRIRIITDSECFGFRRIPAAAAAGLGHYKISLWLESQKIMK